MPLYYRCAVVLMVLLFVLFQPVPGHCSIPSTLSEFPEYDVIAPNVKFWEQVFSTWSESQSAVHDARHLDIVYAVIDVKPGYGRSIRRVNRKRQNAAIKKYKAILAGLARGKKELTPEEQRVADLFGDRAGPKAFKQAMVNIRCQKGLKESFRKGLIRAAPYLERFRRIFNEYGLPEDLVYLPCVESSYDLKAYSRFGAAGIWQFTRSTGRRYMRVDYVVDERRDPLISTVAAARLLKKNFDMTQSWPLAITAYNHGLNGILRAKKRVGGYEHIFTTYRSRTFKFASRNFYSEFLAARNVAKNAKVHFGRIPKQNSPELKRLTLRGFADAKALAVFLNIELDTLRQLNPALRKPVFSGQKHIPKDYQLWLPAGIPVSKLNQIPKRLFSAKQKPSRFHRVEKGDTAGKIARIHGVRVKDLILANNLDRRATIYIGQNLRIPVLGKGGATIAKTAPPDKVAVAKVAPVTGDTVPVASPVQPAVLESPAVPSPEAIAPVTGKTPPNIVLGHLKVEKVIQEKGDDLGVVRIEAAETLGHLAMWLEVPTQSIRRLNRLRYGQAIAIDRPLKVPLNRVSALEFEGRRYEYHMGLEEDFFDSYQVSHVARYRVEPGDNLWTLCQKRFEIPMWLLRKYNPGINPGRIRPGQEIAYPVVIEGVGAAG